MRGGGLEISACLRSLLFIFADEGETATKLVIFFGRDKCMTLIYVVLSIDTYSLSSNILIFHDLFRGEQKSLSST